MNYFFPKNLGTRRCVMVLFGAASLIVAGCASTKIPGGAAAYTVVPMKDADVVPKFDDGSTEPRRTRVVVLSSDESPSARGAGLAEVATATVESVLGGGGIEVVERRLANRLDQELKLSEVKGSGSYGGPDVADYAIRVVMGPAGWDSTYVQPTSFQDKKGNVTNIPGGYTNSGKSNMTIRIYQIPSLRLIQSMPVEGRVSNSQQPSAATQANAAGLMRGATERGVRSKSVEVLNEFAPRSYVSERRVKEKQSIFRVQLGRKTGAKPGDPVEILTLQKVSGPDGKPSFDEVTIGSGLISDIVGDAGSWIIVDQEDVAARVRRGDIVRVKAKGGLSLQNLLKLPN